MKKNFFLNIKKCIYFSWSFPPTLSCVKTSELFEDFGEISFHLVSHVNGLYRNPEDFLKIFFLFSYLSSFSLLYL